MLLQSCLDEKWWADSMAWYCYLRNVQDLLADGKTPYERRFGEFCKGPVIPFGAMVEYHPCSAKDHSRPHRFGKKVLPGIFLGYALYAGGIWKGDIQVTDSEEVENFGRVRNPCSKTQCKRNYHAENGENFISPIADGGDDEIRKSTVRGEELSGDLEEVGNSQPRDELLDDRDACNDLWSIEGNYIDRHHVKNHSQFH